MTPGFASDEGDEGNFHRDHLPLKWIETVFEVTDPD